MHTYEEYKCIAEEMMTKKADWYNDVLRMLGDRTGRAFIGGGLGAGIGYLAGESPTAALAGGIIGGGLGYLSGGEKTPEERSKDSINEEYARNMAAHARSKDPEIKRDMIRQHNYNWALKKNEEDYNTGKTGFIGYNWNTFGTKARGWLSDVAYENEKGSPFRLFPKLIRYVHGDLLTPTRNQYTYIDTDKNSKTYNQPITKGLGGSWKAVKNLAAKRTDPNNNPIIKIERDVVDTEGIDSEYKEVYGDKPPSYYSQGGY